jgi:2-polyprenyl-3-methyl-5-hydroxy-6-metoxy-1,4-benzoquinol methylase
VISDSAKAYERHAREFLCARDEGSVGVGIVENWSSSLAAGTDVLEIACGGGLPVTQTLVNSGLKVWAVDASPTLLSSFRSRFPGIPVQCVRIQESNYFGRRFGAVISIGLLFLLDEEDQLALIRSVSEHLLPGGRFLFTAPIEEATWMDLITGHDCTSLGRARYESALRESGLQLTGTYVDEGKNNHYDARLAL